MDMITVIIIMVIALFPISILFDKDNKIKEKMREYIVSDPGDEQEYIESKIGGKNYI
jgi:hypothetical protein